LCSTNEALNTKPRSVLTVFGWVNECLADWIGEVRPLLLKDPRARTLWPTERGGKISDTRIDQHFATVHRELGLPSELTFHSLRRSYVTHLIEDGFDARFVQEQVGHEHASTTSIYTCVSSDFRTRSLRSALERSIGPLGLDIGSQRSS
jgi:integrase/recombinase XerC